MLRLAQAPNIVIATLWADTLCEAGIAATVQREHLLALAGHLPPDQCLPEVWLTHEQQEPQARQLLDDLQQIRQRQWRCICGEEVEGGFEQCWGCGRLMPIE